MNQRTEELTADPRWQAIRRIVESEAFSRSARLSELLLFVAARALQGQEDELTEEAIGVQFFRRDQGYIRSDDNIVRANASRLRNKLNEYYRLAETEQIRVALPKGSYVPTFEIAPKSVTEPLVSEDPPSLAAELPDRPLQSEASQLRRVPRYAGILLAMIFGAMLGGLGTWRWTKSATLNEAVPNGAIVLFRQLASADGRLLLVPGDAGLNMYSNVQRRTVGVQEYSKGTYLHDANSDPPASFEQTFPSRRYVSIDDLNFVFKVSQIPRGPASRTDVEFARDLHFTDLQNSGVILMGSPNYCPWVDLFATKVDFTMRYDGLQNSIAVLNKAPANGEKDSYVWWQRDSARNGYAIISLTDNLQKTGKVLLIEGTTSAGVAMATNFLFNARQIDPITKWASQQGKGPANFDLLLGTTFYNGGSPMAVVLAKHLHP